MENEIKLSSEQINSFIGSLDEKDKSQLHKVAEGLSSKDKQQLLSVIRDPKRLSALLSSPGAEKLIAMIKSKKE